MPADPASFIVGLAIMLAAGLLYQLGVSSQIDGEPGPELERWRRWRRRYRLGVTLMIAGVGGCALAAGMIGPGKPWMFLWGATAPLLVVTLLLAALDAMQTQRFYRNRLPQLRRRSTVHAESPSESAADGEPPVND